MTFAIRFAAAPVARFAIAFAAAGGLLAATGALAQAFPTKPVRLIVPNPPGGGIDIMARVYAPPLQSLLGQPVLVEYKPGAGSALGTEYVANSSPDGHTVGIVVTAHVINPAVRVLGFDTVKDLSGVAMTGVSHVGIAASSTLAANSLRELATSGSAQDFASSKLEQNLSLRPRSSDG